MSNFFKNLKQEKLDKGLELLDSCLDDIAYARMLLTKNTHDVNWKDDAGNSILHVLVYNELCKPAELLLKHGADPNIANKNDETPLHWCATMNSKKCAKVLIEAKCNIDSVDNSGSTPLHYAASTNNLEMIPLLLDNGASVNIMDKDGLTAIELAAEGKSTAAYAVTILLLRYYQQNNLPLPKLVKKNLSRFLSQPNQTPAVVYVPAPSHTAAAAAAQTGTALSGTGPVVQAPLPPHLSAQYQQVLREAALARVQSDSEEAAGSSPKGKKSKKPVILRSTSDDGTSPSGNTATPAAVASGGGRRDSRRDSTSHKDSTLVPIQAAAAGAATTAATTAAASSASRSPGTPSPQVHTPLSLISPTRLSQHSLTMELGHVAPTTPGTHTVDDLEMYHHNSLKTIAETLFPPTPFPPVLLSKASGSKFLDVVVAVEHCVDCESHNKLSLRHDSAQYTKVANDCLFGIIKSVIEQKFAIRLFAYRTKSTKYEGKLGGMEVTIAVNLTPQLSDEAQHQIQKSTASNKIHTRNKHASLDFSANLNVHLKTNPKISNLSGIDHHTQSGHSLMDLREDQLHGVAINDALHPATSAGIAAGAADKDYQNWATHQIWSKLDSKSWPNINFVKDKVVAFLNTTLKEHCTTLAAEQHHSDDEEGDGAGSTGIAAAVSPVPQQPPVENQYKHQTFSVAQIRDIRIQYSEWVERMKLPPIVERHKLDLDWPQLFPNMEETSSATGSKSGKGSGAAVVKHCQGPMLDLELKEKAKKVDFEKAVMKHFLVYDCTL